MRTMTTKTRNALVRLIKKHGLTTQQVADLCLVERGTVESWRKSPDVSSHRSMPPGYLELLQIKVGEKQP
tara:strand:- start:2923 stop:3132 length:210 start_codon:yes stop_codon:yes gene_type:complete